ncbi:MAG: hypothetical protein GXP62_03490, partial [Oligoflexia bacterium]|nr:hypothetical protein [Oligoflexia bacterium]
MNKPGKSSLAHDGLPWKRVQIAVALPLMETWTYAVPKDTPLQLGHAVLVPFGRRRVSGYVVGPGDPGLASDRLKPIARLLDPIPAFDAAQLAFFQWIARYYLSGLGEVIATALPSGLKAHTRRVIVPTEPGIRALAMPSLVDDARTLALREVVSRPGLTKGGLVRRLRDELEPDAVGRALAGLDRAGLVRWEQRETQGPKGRVPVA